MTSFDAQPTARPALHEQAGVALLEVLIALLIFSFGILGLVGLQIASSQNSAEVEIRGEAAFLANQVLAEMWTIDRTLVYNLYHSGADGTANATNNVFYQRWRGRVINGSGSAGGANTGLPGAGSTTALNPSIEVTNPGNFVTITVRWQRPGSTAHQHQISSQLVGKDG